LINKHSDNIKMQGTTVLICKFRVYTQYKTRSTRYEAQSF
jgi:hypothetical protein